MSLTVLHLSILYVLYTIAVGLSVTPVNSNALRQHEPNNVNGQPFFTSTEKATYRRIGTTRSRKLSRNTIKSGASKKVDGSRLRTKAGRMATQKLLILRRNDTKTAFTTNYPKRLSSQRSLDKTDRNIMRNAMRKVKSKSSGGIGGKATRVYSNEKQRRPIGVRKEERAKVKRRGKGKGRIINYRVSKNVSGTDFPTKTENSTPVPRTRNHSTLEKMSRLEHVPLNVPCGTTSSNESSLSLRNLFHVPRMNKIPYCSSRKHRIIDEQRHEEHEESSAVPIRSFDRGHTELINEYESARSIDVVGVEYVHPEGHVLSPFFASRRVDTGQSVTRNEENATNFSTDLDKPIVLPSESNVASWKRTSSNAVSTHPQKIRGLGSEGDGSSSVPGDYVIADGTIDIDTDENDYYVGYSSLRKKRETDETSIEYRRASSKAQQIKESVGPNVATKSNLPKGPDVESTENTRSDESGRARIQNSTSQLSTGLRNIDDTDTTETSWPLVPGPISCDLDFQLRASFVAKLGEFDYVVSVQRQRNPDVPSDHACTGVVYNPRFVVIAPHCLHDLCDNYGLTVASTDDLCTIDETIEVDYVIEHENYDAETRKNDIALIKLKSEIHKKPATFSTEDGSLGKLFYAVGFGELMWKSYPTKISKLLQKIPVRRYTHVSKDAAETLYITTSNLDLTGAFRGDFGGALINPQGEFVGLKSKLVKKSTGYDEVYTRVRTYLPWIESMVALHGSW